MEKTIRTLKILYFVPLLVCLALVGAYETGLLTAGALWGCSSRGEFIVTTVLELVSIGVIPLALRLFRLRRVAAALRGEARALRRYGARRIALLMLPMVADTIAYYLFLSVPCGYLAIILLLASIFVYPSSARCTRETQTNTTDE